MNTLEHIRRDKHCVICDKPIPLTIKNRLYCESSECQEAKRAIHRDKIKKQRELKQGLKA